MGSDDARENRSILGQDHVVTWFENISTIPFLTSPKSPVPCLKLLLVHFKLESTAFSCSSIGEL